MDNTSLTVLEGTVLYEIEDAKPTNLLTGMAVNVTSNKFHKVKNIGSTPAFYMYSFTNTSQLIEDTKPKPYLPIVSELTHRFKGFLTFAKIIMYSLFELKECQ